jgi:selenocysteine-specific elongation factor
MAPAALESLQKNLAEFLQSHPTFTISEIREHWNMTRKHAVPIFEYFDRQQITQRIGDLRTEGQRLQHLVRGTTS